MSQPSPLPAPKVRAPLLLKLALMACVLAVVPLAVVGVLLVDVNRAAVEELHRATSRSSRSTISRAPSTPSSCAPRTISAR